MSDHDFNTPPWLIQLVTSLDRRGIGLDPCSNAFSMVEASKTYDARTNGLGHTWRGYGIVFVNPPHSISPHNIEPWMQKASDEFLDIPIDREDQPHDSLVMLIPAKPDTAWFHDTITRFSCRCFLRGRPKYWQHGKEMPGPGKFPSMVAYVGLNTGLFMATFDTYGWVI